MELFLSYGFKDIDDEIKKGLIELNPNIFPHLCRYQEKGMGWYDVLVEKNGLFRIVSSGGENGWRREDNDETYALITGRFFVHLEELFKTIEKKSWEEVVAREEFSGGFKQETIRIEPN